MRAVKTVRGGSRSAGLADWRSIVRPIIFKDMDGGGGGPGNSNIYKGVYRNGGSSGRTAYSRADSSYHRKLTMFARAYTALYVLLSLSVLAAAKPWGAPPPTTTTVTVTAPAPTVTTVSQCNTGPIQCCQQVESVSCPGMLILTTWTNSLDGYRQALQRETCSWASWVSFCPI